MLDILKVLAVFALIVLLLRKKWGIGYVMLIAAGGLALLYLMRPEAVFETALRALNNGVTVKLLIALTSIKVFELVLRERNILAEMMNASKGLLKNRKAVVISMPLLIGLLPSVGGAYFSAPMVEESARGINISAEEKGFINYWYRHPWEYILPLYPGVVLASAISGMEMRKLILLNLSYAAMLAVTGFIFSMREIKGKYHEAPPVSRKGLMNFIPISVVILLVVVFHVELHWALLGSVIVLFAFFRYGLREILRAVRHGLEPDVIMLIVGIMLFKEVMEASGAVGNISGYFGDVGIPLMPTLFLLPFMTGLLTGLTVGFVGGTFPLILSLLTGMNISGAAALSAISFAFASGYMGVLLSPVHVCFVLTREYFKADLWGMYRRIIPASSIVIAVASAQYLILRSLA